MKAIQHFLGVTMKEEKALLLPISISDSNAEPRETLTLLDLPKQLIEMIAKHTGTPELANLASTCSRLHFLLHPTVKERYALLAKELMGYVLYPTRGNIAKAKAMLAANPQIMFIETEGFEKSSGIEEYVDEAGQAQTRAVYKKIKGSPFQAALGTGDSELYQYMATHFDKVQAGVATAQKQMQEQFRNGVEYPPSTYNFTPIITAITNDQTLITTNDPSAQTKAIIAQFRNDFMVSDNSQGHHYNFNDLIEALNAYNQNWNAWNVNQRLFFYYRIIGYFERRFSLIDVQAFIEGIDYHLAKIANNEEHDRRLTIYDMNSNTHTDWLVGSTRGLGLDQAVTIGTGGLNVYSLPWTEVCPNALKNYANDKQQRLINFSKSLNCEPSQEPQRRLNNT